MGRKALITGATGGLGRNLAELLLKKGYQVRTTGRNKDIGLDLHNLGTEFIAGDLVNPDTADKLVKGQDLIYHCAALSSPWGAYSKFYDINVTATEYLLEAAMKYGVETFIQISTPSIYFAYRDQLGVRENDPLPSKLVNPYAQTKFIADQRVMEYHRRGLQTVTLRPRALFGEHDNVIIPRILKAVRGKIFPVFNKGKAIINMTYIGNVADALLLCDYKRETANGRIFNITNDEDLIVSELLTRIFEALNMDIHLRSVPFSLAYGYAGFLECLHSLLPGEKEPPATRYSAAILAYNQTLDISAAKQILGYKPRVSVKEGLNRYAEWMQQKSSS